MYKIVLYLLTGLPLKKLASHMKIFCKRGMQAPLQTNLLLIKRKKEFCVPPGRVHLVFVVHGDWAFGTSA